MSAGRTNIRGVNRAPIRRSAALLCALAVLATGCKSGFQKKLFVAPSLSASAVFVTPFGFRWPEPAYRSFELSHKVLDIAQEKVGEQVLLFGPPEFKVYRAEDNGWAGSSAVTLLPAARVRPENALLLRPWAEKRITSSRREITNAQGKAVGVGAGEDVTFIGHVELIHPSTQTLVVEVVGEAAVDPFAEKKPEEEADPAPELTKLMQALTAEAFAQLQGHLKPPAAPRELPVVSLAFHPAEAFRYAEEGRPALDSLAQDALELELLRTARVRYANPSLSDAEAAKLLKLPGGLIVKEAKPGSPLKEGDVITTVEGQPALPPTLQRARFKEGVLLKVRRTDGSTTEVVL